MGDLTPHFSLWEFRSRDGAITPESVKANIKKTAQMLEKLRARLSEKIGQPCPISILSGYRSAAYNKAVGGVPTSYHLKGMAADITSRLASPRTIQAVARELQNEGIIGGLGAYPGFTHVDWGVRRTWGVSNRKEIGGISSS